MVQRIIIDAVKRTGGRTCEVICSLTHSKGHINPRDARVRVYRDDVEGIFAPVVAGPSTSVECINEPKVTLTGRQGNLSALWAIFTDSSMVCNLCGM